MMRENELADVARRILAQVQGQHPEVQMYQQDGSGLAPDMAIVILSPSGAVTPVQYGLAGPSTPEQVSPGVVVDSPLLLKSLLPATALKTYPVDKMLNVRGAFLTLIVIDNSTDIALTIQAIGHLQDAPGDENGRVNLGGAQAMAAGNTTVQRLGIAVVRRDYPYPFLGVTITVGGAGATLGQVVVQGYVEKWPIQGVGV